MNKTALRQCFSKPVATRTLGVAVVVGTLLTAINQDDAILAGEAPTLWKAALNCLVPFMVVTYGAYSVFGICITG